MPVLYEKLRDVQSEGEREQEIYTYKNEKESVAIVIAAVVCCTCHLAKGRTFQVATGNWQLATGKMTCSQMPMGPVVVFWSVKHLWSIM